jgi:hypothetical protein
MGYHCKNKSCKHCEMDHPDPNTCLGAHKCTTDICECEAFTPDYYTNNNCP